MFHCSLNVFNKLSLHNFLTRLFTNETETDLKIDHAIDQVFKHWVRTNQISGARRTFGWSKPGTEINPKIYSYITYYINNVLVVFFFISVTKIVVELLLEAANKMSRFSIWSNRTLTILLLRPLIATSQTFQFTYFFSSLSKSAVQNYTINV